MHATTEEDEKEMLGTPVVFFDTAGCEYFERLDGDAEEGSRCNENEATIVKNWVDKLVRRQSFIFDIPCAKVCQQVAVGIMPDQIAVITPYDNPCSISCAQTKRTNIDIKHR